MEKWRLLDTETPRKASMNLAIDEAIFLEKIRGTIPPTLRFWRNERAVVLGYFQSVEAEVNLELCKRGKIQVVRRFSGGGAVYHDLGNLNYSIAVENDHPLLKGLDMIETYEMLCSGIIEGLREFGLRVLFEPPSDLLARGKKISGAAQSRKKGVIFHHGTLLIDADVNLLTRVLDSSKEKPGHKGVTSRKRPVTNLRDEVPFEIDMVKVKGSLQRGFERAFSIQTVPGELASNEMKTAEKLYAAKYSQREWNFWR